MKILFKFVLLTLISQPSYGSETIVGKLLAAELTVYEQAARSVLNVVLRVNNGSYVLVTCDQVDGNAEPSVDLREASVLMQAFITAGSGLHVETVAVRDSSKTGFPRYQMKTWNMPIPGVDAYKFDCVNI
jgi:hypothetical protein